MPMETVPAVPLPLPPADFELSAGWFPELWLLTSPEGTGDEGRAREGCVPLKDGGGDTCITNVGGDESEGESEDGEVLGVNVAGEGGESLGGP